MAARVLVLADDLIWQTRLVAAVRAAGAVAEPAAGLPALQRSLASVDAVLIDLTARAYEPLDAVRAVASARPGLPLLAVGPHDDHERRRQALEAGASRALAYRKLHEDGPSTIRRWLERTSEGSAGAEPTA